MLANVYAVEVSLAESTTGILAKNLLALAVEDLGGLRVQVLLGRDILTGVILTYDGPAREFTLRIE